IHLRSATDDPRVHSAEGSKVIEKYLGLPAKQGQPRLCQAVADKKAKGGRAPFIGRRCVAWRRWGYCALGPPSRSLADVRRDGIGRLHVALLVDPSGVKASRLSGPSRRNASPAVRPNEAATLPTRKGGD